MSGRGVRFARLAAAPPLAGLLLALPASTEAQSWRTVTMSRQLDRTTEAVEVDVDYGTGRLHLAPAEPGLLYRMRLRYDEESRRPVAEYEDGRLQLGVEAIGDHPLKHRDGSEGEMEVELARGVPMGLDLDFGAGRAEVELGGLSLTELTVRTGASQARIAVSEPNPVPMRRARFEVGAADFEAHGLGNLDVESLRVSAGVGNLTLDMTGAWRRDGRVSIDMGLGALELRFPRGVGVRLRKSTFLTTLDAQELVKRGDTYYSTDWEEAERRITVDVDAAFGSIRVAWEG